MNHAIKTYHHGNLRDALIIAAATLIEQQGTLDFSITDAARRVGVSSAAPYRHFQDKEALLRAVRDLAFLDLHQRSLACVATSSSPAGSIEQIIELGWLYLDFAREKRCFFTLMWGDRGDMAERKQRNQQADMSGFSILRELVASYIAKHRLSAEHEAVAIATQLWAMAHGIATLELNQMLDHFNPKAGADALLASSTRALLTGLRLG